MKNLLIIILCLAAGNLIAQKSDSVIINVGKSRLIIVVNDPADLEKLEQYDLNTILKELKLRLTEDSLVVNERNGVVEDTVVDRSTDDRYETRRDDRWRNRDNGWNERDNSWRHRDVERREKIDSTRVYSSRRKVRHLLNFDIGTNNYLEGGGFPDNDNAQYSVRPWGSWYFGINSIYQIKLSKRVFFEVGPGISWYNFKFQDDRTLVSDNNGITEFISDPDDTKDYKKSKLTASFINVSAVPYIQFGTPKRRRSVGNWNRWTDVSGGGGDAGLRVGLGGYAGYRLGSHSKVKYQGGKKDKDRDDFNLTNFRYGVRAQIGFRGTDFFFNYDLNELFRADRGPNLNAFSFGIIL